jgi:hypothetical protein
MQSDVPVFYDCEASCIGGLPIEIGWAFLDVSTSEIQSESVSGAHYRCRIPQETWR